MVTVVMCKKLSGASTGAGQIDRSYKLVSMHTNSRKVSKPQEWRQMVSYTFTDSDGIRTSKEVIRVTTASTCPTEIHSSTKKNSLDLCQLTKKAQKVPIFTPKLNSKLLKTEPAALQRSFITAKK